MEFKTEKNLNSFGEFFTITAKLSGAEAVFHDNLLKAVFEGMVDKAVEELLEVRREELLKKLDLDTLSETIKTEIGKAFAQKALDNLGK